MSERPTELMGNTTKANLVILACLFIFFTFLMLLDHLTGILILLGASLILTYILLGPVTLIESALQRVSWLPEKRRRSLAIMLVYLLFFASIAVVVVQVLPPLVTQVREFARDVPTFITRWEERTGVNPSQPNETDANVFSSLLKSSLRHSVSGSQTERLTSVPVSESVRRNGSRFSQHKITRGYVGLAPPTEPAATPDTNMSQVLKLLQQYTSQMLQYVLNIGTTTITGFVYMLTALVMVFYMLQDGSRLKNGFVNLMPTRLEEGADEFLTRLHVQFFSFIKGQVVMSFIAGVLMYFLLLLLNVKYAFLLSIVFGITSIIPVIGPWFGLVPVLLVEAFSDHPFYIINVLMFVGIYYLLKTYWLWPRLISRHYDIHPVIFILTFLACLKTVSFLGILMSFPLATILAATLEFVKDRNAAKPAVSP